MVLFTLLAFAIILAMFVGQFRVARRALHERKAGVGQFTYSLDESPKAFIAKLVLVWLGLVIVFAYSMALAVGVLFS